MNEERMRVLEMVRDGKISAEEGARLLEALQPKKNGPPPSATDHFDDPVGRLASAVAEALQTGNWRGLAGSFVGSWTGGPLTGLERRRQREAEGWQFLTFSEGDHGTFDLPADARLVVEHEAGSIESIAGDGPARLELEGEGTHDFSIYVARKEQEVLLAAHRTAPFARMPRLKLSVPRHVAHVSLRTAGGSLTADGFACPVSLKTAGGSIRVSDHRADAVEAKTAGGGIKVDGTPSRLDLKTSGGSIRFEGRTESFNVKTSGGSIHLSGVHLTSGEHSAKTSGGSVRIELSRDSSVEVTAKTSAGKINADLPGAEGEHSGSRFSPSYRGRYNGGSAQLHVATSAGSVSIGLAEESNPSSDSGHTEAAA
ncbi:MAG TPA: DUF4097 family beta strand repeat-containing protein [Chloroflexota bacterium]|nr:DUF4097 family beta strand repeat-containing protein [Chloroflexota bacterium]